ncbi:MAG: hypothetical protein A2075_00470 [Geobacteraceae bacterium GWC2_58_44]|nr:MAG: hypothetical protein A2075_00470 [Geobacteraceae bacterium GWC2_58_44]
MQNYRGNRRNRLKVLLASVSLGMVLSHGAAVQAAPQYAFDCTSCHNMPPLDSGTPRKNPYTGAVPGNHETHSDATVNSCAECHGAGVTTLGNAHRNKVIELTGEIGYSLGFVNQTSLPPVPLGSCSTARCHGNGKGVLQITPAWGTAPYAAPADCAECHGVAPASGNHPSLTAAGRKHGEYYGTGVDACVKCHPDHLAEAKPFGHANEAGRAITLSFGSPVPGGSFAAGSCSALYCHSNGQGVAYPVSWGGTLPADCSGCHGNKTSGTLSGRHAEHVNNDTALGTSYGCAECHADTVSDDLTVSNRANHVDGLMNYSGDRAGSFGSGTCSSVYCHSDGRGTMKTLAAGSWSSGAAMDCKGCHGSDAAPAFASVAGEPDYANAGADQPRANSHQKHVNSAATCRDCHASVTDDGLSIKAGAPHIDRVIDTVAGPGTTFQWAGTTCSNASCHSGNGIVANVLPAKWGATLGCDGCHGMASSGSLSGQHASHVNNLAGLGTNYGCVECHAPTVTNDVSIATPARHLNLMMDYSGARAGRFSGGSCATVYCHSDGKGTMKALGAGSWNSGTTLDCSGCHGSDAAPAFASAAGAPNYANAGADQLRANSHQKHATSCRDCHTGVSADGRSITAGAPHVDGAINVAAGPGQIFSWAGSTCSNVSCHSGGGIIANVAPAKWGAVLDCTGCHGMAASGTLSGKHAVHGNNNARLGTSYGCVACHANTVSSDSSISTPALHGNAMADYSGARAGRLVSGSCSTVYCHSDGKGTLKPLAASDWSAGAPLSCSGCHGSDAAAAFASIAGEPNYANSGADTLRANNHQKHVTSAATCRDCHATTSSVDGLTLIPGSAHTNGVNDVAAGNGKSFDWAGSSCSNVSCHSGGGMVANVGPVKWGETLGCNGCHGDAANLATDAHASHVSAMGYSCAVCHAQVVSGSSTIINQSLHTDSVAQVAGSFGYSSADKSCASACHMTSAPKWNVADSGRCGTCHAALSGNGGVITSAAHGVHYSAPYGPQLDAASADSCAVCHVYTTSTAPSHVNGITELAADSAVIGTCGGCHRQSSNWNTGAVSCESCHTMFQGRADTLSVIGGVTAQDVSYSASSGHGKSGVDLGCSACHDGSGAHLSPGSNKRLLSSLTGPLNTDCNYCHNDPAKVDNAGFRNMSSHMTVRGGAADMACALCHDPHGSANLSQIRSVINGKPITFTDRANHWVDSASNQGLCQVCHFQTNRFKAGVAENSHPQTDCFTCHKHNAAGGAFKLSEACDACHGYPPAPRNVAGLSFGTMGNWSSARFEDYSGGGGSHLVADHVSPNARPSEGWANCAKCHNGGSSGPAPYHLGNVPIADNIENISIKIDPAYRFSDDAFIVYTGARHESGNNKTGSCFNVSCHFKPSPQWSTER